MQVSPYGPSGGSGPVSGQFPIDGGYDAPDRYWDDPWFDHYYDGGGAPFDLHSFPGLYDAWLNHSETQGAMPNLDSLVAGKCGNYSISYFDLKKVHYNGSLLGLAINLPYFQTNEDSTSLFPIGNSTLSVNAECSCVGTCWPGWENCLSGRRTERRCYQCSCNVTVSLVANEWFSDAQDLINFIPGDQEFEGGMPYRVMAIHSYSKSVSGCNTSTAGGIGPSFYR